MRPEFPSAPMIRLLLLAALASPGVAAQEPPEDEPATGAEPDISLTATPGRREVDRTWRDNLPEEILPGRTYRDIGVRFEASTTLDPDAVDPFRIDVDADPLQPQDEATP